MNNPDIYFPELNIPFLEKFVQDQMIKQFGDLPLKKVVLYKYSGKFFPHVARKYVLSFELSIERDKLNADQREKIEELDELMRETVFEENLIYYENWGLDNSFKDVYRNRPPRKDFFIEWFLLVKMPDKEMPLGVKIDQPHVTLYDSSGKKGKGQDKKKTKKLIEDRQEKLSKESGDWPEKQADGSVPIISFYKKDDYWQIGKEGNEAHLKPLKGYEFIQFLIRNENESFDPITLYYKGNVPEELEGLKSGTSSQEKYDIKVLGSVNKEIEVLTEKLKETSDIEEKEEIQEKIKKRETYLNNSNRLFSESDRIRRNVRERIKLAIEKLHEKAEKKPALSPLKKYLTIEGPAKTIKIGFESYYKSNPSDPVKWKLDSN